MREQAELAERGAYDYDQQPASHLWIWVLFAGIALVSLSLSLSLSLCLPVWMRVFLALLPTLSPLPCWTLDSCARLVRRHGNVCMGERGRRHDGSAVDLVISPARRSGITS